MNASHVELTGSRRPPGKGSRRVRDVDPHALIELTITLSAPPLPGPDAMPSAPMSPAEFAKNYGVSDSDVQKVESVLRGFGLTIQGVSADRRSVRVSGSAASVEAAFQPNMAVYHSATLGEYRGREGMLSIPAALDGLVTAVLGIDQRQVAHRKVAKKGAARASVAPALALAGGPLTPDELEQRYDFPPGDGAGQVIAVAEFGIPINDSTVLAPAYIPDDVSAFCGKYNRHVPQIVIVPVNLAPLTPAQLAALPRQARDASADITGEVMMDIEIIASLCPRATINVYFASFDQKGWVDLLDEVISGQPARPVTLSISWGMAEDSPDWSQSALSEINNRLQAAAMQGITVCVASGDDGSGDQINDNRGHADFPASSPFVLGVGGTMLELAGTEVGWWQSPGRRNGKGGGATGGGVSAITARPAWQKVTVPSINPASIDGRVVPDVAALAGSPGYDLILFGEESSAGGTSASAPVWAALLTRINAKLPAGKQQRFLTPLLYGVDGNGQPIGISAFRDISKGKNVSSPNPGRGYMSGAGYDAVTGWGAPVGMALLAALS